MNPAQRVVDRLEQAMRSVSKPNNPMEIVWASVFGVANQKAPERTRAVAGLLSELHDQLEFAQEILVEKGVPRALYVSEFAKLSRVLLPTTLPEAFQNVRAAFDPVTLLCLKWAAWTIGPMEDSMTVEQREEIQGRMRDLEVALADPGVAPQVGRFLNTQLERLRKALADYDTAGAAPLTEAMETVIGAMSVRRDELADAGAAATPATKSALDRFKDLYQVTAKVVASVSATADGAVKLIEHGKHVVKWLGLGD